MNINLIRIALLLSLLAAPTAYGQAVAFQATGDNETGWNPLGSYNYGDFDNIDLANGAVNLKITIAKMTARGHTSHYDLQYTSKFWSVYPIQHQLTYTANWQVDGGATGIPGPAAGWMKSDSFGTAVGLTHVVTPLQCFNNGKQQTLNIDSNWVYTDVEGGKHNFPNWRWHSVAPGPNEDCGIPVTEYLIGYASDNSGAYLDVSTTKVSFPSGQYSPVANAHTLDANGNSWDQFTAANGQVFVQTTSGTGGQGATIQVLDASGAWQSYTLTYGQTTPTASFPNPYNGSVSGRTLNTLTGVALPNGRSFQFQYGASAGELSQVTLPTGGYIKYQYATVPTQMYASGWATFVPADGRCVTSRTVSSDGTTGSEKTWTYSYSRTDPTNPSSPLTTTVTNPDGSSEIHVFNRSGSDPYHEISVEYHDAGGALKKKIANTWTSDQVPTITEFESTPLYNSGNYRVTNTTTTLDDGQQTEVNLYFDTLSYTDIYHVAVNTTRGNIKKKEETAFGPTAPGAVVRVTKFQYLYEFNSAYLTPYILNPVTAMWVGTPSNTLSLRETAYDTTTPTGLHGNPSLSKSALLAAGAPNPDNTPPDSSVSSWLSTTNSFDSYGNLTTSVAPASKNYTTTFEYAQCSSGLLSATNFPVTSIRTEETWNCNIGQPSQTKDANLKLTNYTYSDPLRRVTRIDFPDSGYETYTYNDSSNSVTTKKNIQLSPLLEYGVNFEFDGLGRLSHKLLTSAPEGTITTDVTYDSVGRKSTTSNPYLSVSDATYGVTTNVYDGLNRITKLIPPDGTASSDNVSTVFAGNCSTVTDQAGKIRKSCSDALGRLTQVFEPDASNALVNETDYAYDALNNLIQVVQKGNATSDKWRSRTFTYNSLSQLTQATNPESGTINYSYDNDGNLFTKTDARSIMITYTYDGLHHLLTKAYSNTEPAVSYSYGNASCLGQPTCANVGRRTGMTDANGSESWSYDVMGRQLVDQRITSGLTKTTVSTHTTGGFVYQLTYPSTRVITYTYDAAGRATSAIDTASGINYATAVSYSPAGPIASMQNGTTLFSTLYYDKRVQPCRISVRSTGSVPTSCTSLTNTGNILDFSYNFGLGTSDNGNVLGITNNRDVTRSQTFGYDTTNRLATGQTTSTFATSAAHCWGETFGYDAWANFLTIGVVSTAYNGCTQQTLNLTGYISVQNQITPAAGYTYDLSGNVKVVTGTGGNSFTYNAEGQMTSNTTAMYFYDGDGKRVKKSSGTLYWYGGGSDALEESDASGNITDEYVFFGGARIAHRKVASGEIDYYFSDHLGTSRVVSNATGTILDDSDFYPFGVERPVVGPTSGNHYKFTGKERDSESGLDNFGARYDSSSMGRFMSPDPDNISGVLHMDDDPQSWNGYSYVRNNPLSLTDPTGTVFCRNAPDPDGHEGTVLLCDVTDAQYVNSSKEQQAAYDKAGYIHFDCTCDTGADKDAWQHRNGNVSPDWIGNGLVFGAVFAGLEGLFYPQLHGPGTTSPQPAPINLADQKATTHILDGDATGGGHAPGTGMPGKSEFPADWSRDRIMDAISDVATDPASKTTTVGRTTLVDGTRDGVNIRVVIRDNQIVTGYPTNLPRNP